MSAKRGVETGSKGGLFGGPAEGETQQLNETSPKQVNKATGNSPKKKKLKTENWDLSIFVNLYFQRGGLRVFVLLC